MATAAGVSSTTLLSVSECTTAKPCRSVSSVIAVRRVANTNEQADDCIKRRSSNFCGFVKGRRRGVSIAKVSWCPEPSHLLSEWEDVSGGELEAESRSLWSLFQPKKVPSRS